MVSITLDPTHIFLSPLRVRVCVFLYFFKKMKMGNFGWVGKKWLWARSESAVVNLITKNVQITKQGDQKCPPR